MIVTTDNGPVEVEKPTPSRPRAVRPPQFAFEWTGTDGETWDLVAGPAEILSGARGFGLPTPQHWRTQALGHGARHNGLRFPPREVYMPVELKSRDMLDADRSFNAGFNPYSTGRLRVTTPKASWREIACRYDEGLEGEYEMDPLLKGSAVYGIRMTAEDPFWLGEPITRTFKTQVDPATRPTFPGPPFYRKRADSLDGEGKVTNPGDVETYAVWTIRGPFTGLSVGIGDQRADMAITRGTSGLVKIDTTGGMTRFTDQNGTNVRANATDFVSPPIPPGETTLRLQVTNPGPTSSVEVSFRPRYYRAW